VLDVDRVDFISPLPFRFYSYFVTNVACGCCVRVRRIGKCDVPTYAQLIACVFEQYCVCADGAVACVRVPSGTLVPPATHTVYLIGSDTCSARVDFENTTNVSVECVYVSRGPGGQTSYACVLCVTAVIA